MVRKADGRFNVSYMGRALDDQNGIIADMREQLRGVKYDTIVVTGSSGMMIGPVLARALRKKLLVVRKKQEAESSHSGAEMIGELGERWIFVDDFCSSGATFYRVRTKVALALEEINRPHPGWRTDKETGCMYWSDDEEILEFHSELVGYVQYQRTYDDTFWTPWDEGAVPGMNPYLEDTPRVVAAKDRRERETQEAEQLQAEREVRQAELYKQTLDAATLANMSATAPTVRTDALSDVRVEGSAYGPSGCSTPGCKLCAEIIYAPVGSGRLPAIAPLPPALV